MECRLAVDLAATLIAASVSYVVVERPLLAVKGRFESGRERAANAF